MLPALYGAAGTNRELCGSSPDWVRAFGDQLEEADIVRLSPPLGTPKVPDPEVSVAVIRQTPLMRRVTDQLAGLGITSADLTADKSFVIIDLSGLDADDSLRLARKVHRRGCRSISSWKRGSETFYGPLVEPLRTACWNCCRLRFSDSISGDDDSFVEDDPTTARVVADNVFLAVRYPDVAAYGCLVVDDGRTSSLHSVVPMPWCETCGVAVGSSASRLAPLTHSVHVPEELRILADTRGGVLRQVFLYESSGAEAPSVPLCCSAVIGSYQDGTRSHPGFQGEGKGATREDAVRSAIGEGVERYAASLWHPSTLTYASFSELGDQAFDPRWLVLYDAEQYARPDFPFAPFDAERPLCWTTGRWLDTGETVRVPALATYMNFPTTAAERFGQTTSSGLAAGATFEDAALRALFELIERDAFMLFWLARRPALRIAEDGCDVVSDRALREVERFGARTELYLIDANTQYPTIVCLGLGDGRSWPGVTIGLGTHADVDIALRRAVLEHGHCGSYIRRLMREGRQAAIRTSADVLTGLDHALYYAHPDHATALEPFRSCTRAPIALAHLRSRYRQDATLASCVSRLREAGIRTAAVDVTSPDIALAPIRVVRAFGIHMQPIHFGVGNRRLRNPRLDHLLSSAAEANPHPIA